MLVAVLGLLNKLNGFRLVVGNSKGGLLVFAALMEGRSGVNPSLLVVSEMSLITDHLIFALEKSITFYCVSSGNRGLPK